MSKIKLLATGAALANPFFDTMEPQTLFDNTTSSSTAATALSTATTINNVVNVANNSTSINTNANLFMTSSSQPTSLTSGFDALGDVLKPGITSTTNTTVGKPTAGTNQTNINTAGIASQDQLLHHQQQQPQQQLTQQQQQQQPASTGKLLTGDLDSSLMSLVENLNINKSATTKPVQWNSPKNTAKPGANWTPQPMAATTGAGYRPMAHGMTVSPAPITINHPYIHASYPVIPNYMQGMPVMGQTMMGQAPLTGVPPTMQQPMVMPSNPAGIMQTTQPQMQTMMQTNGGNKPLDPFGAL